VAGRCGADRYFMDVNQASDPVRSLSCPEGGGGTSVPKAPAGEAAIQEHLEEEKPEGRTAALRVKPSGARPKLPAVRR